MTAQQVLGNFFQPHSRSFSDMAAQMIAKANSDADIPQQGIGLKFFGSAASAGSFSQAQVLVLRLLVLMRLVSLQCRFTLLHRVAMYLGRLVLLLAKVVRASTSSLNPKCVKAWRVTRVVLVALPVIPESGEAGTVGGGGGTAVAAPIDVRYTVERINDVEYVTAAQVQAGMQQAAAQGAQRGEQQTLRRLQMSGSTRRRIGL